MLLRYTVLPVLVLVLVRCVEGTVHTPVLVDADAAVTAPALRVSRRIQHVGHSFVQHLILLFLAFPFSLLLFQLLDLLFSQDSLHPVLVLQSRFSLSCTLKHFLHLFVGHQRMGVVLLLSRLLSALPARAPCIIAIASTASQPFRRRAAAALPPVAAPSHVLARRLPLELVRLLPVRALNPAELTDFADDLPTTTSVAARVMTAKWTGRSKPWPLHRGT